MTKYWYFLCAALVFAGCSTSAERGRDRKIERVILISVDDLRADFLGAYNPEMKTSPNLDRFASESVVCTNVTSQAPSTAISHKSILYSLYPFAHKTTKNVVPEEKLKSPLEVLQSEEFKTAAFVGGGQLSRKFGFAKGFDHFWQAEGRARRNRPKADLEETERVVVQWLDQNYRNPFFLFLHTYEVHCPYDPPEEYRRQYASWYKGDIDPKGKCGDNYYNQRKMSPEDFQYIRDLYAGQVRYVDALFGRLFAHLKKLGIYDQTMIVFLADHGESLGERGQVGHNQLYHVQLRIPLILRIPGIAPQKIDAPLEAIDAMPTIFSALDVKNSFPFQGKNLLSLLQQKNAEANNRLLISEQAGKVRAQQGEWAALFLHRSNEADELYNLRDDPGELKNLAVENPAKVKELKRQYFQLVEGSRQIAANFVVTGSSEPQLDAETREQLEALGYVND